MPRVTLLLPYIQVMYRMFSSRASRFTDHLFCHFVTVLYNPMVVLLMSIVNCFFFLTITTVLAANLFEENKRTPETTFDDVFIRRFMKGTWHGLLQSEIIIKRRHNMIVIAGIVLTPHLVRKLYFLQGYTEELLSHLFKMPVKVEIQTVMDRKDMAFKYV